ncbi:CRISPR type III-a/mtube-associated ramp protein csm4 [Firmicutes bacterium M10-2]|nr:CRISPR type III-a/mtube-associated ramp protein csm4 [Firmicutes bacterium M10-2]
MQTYRLIFSSVSVLNQIPDAQTIFGALCGIIKKKDGEKVLNAYLDSLRTNEPWFVHSSMFPLDLFPFPSENLFSLEFIEKFIDSQKDGESKLFLFSEFKKYKKLKYVSVGILTEYILSGRLDQLRKDLLTKQEKFSIIEDQEILRLREETITFQSVNVLSIRNSIRKDSLDKDLFYESQLFVPKDQQFQVLVKTDQDIGRIRLYFSLLEYTGIGSNRSVGMNSFHLENIEEFHFENQNERAYLLSKCIPEKEEFDFEQSSYRVDSKLFRGSNTYVYGDYVGRFTRLLEGSLCKPAKKKEYYGQLISIFMDGKIIDHYGIGMVV